MKKLSTMIIGALITCAPALHAQLTTRTGNESEVSLATRPVKGTKMLTFNFDIPGGGDISPNLEDNLYTRLGLSNGRLISVKYFLKPEVAIRGAINITRNSSISKGDIDTTGGSTTGVISNDMRSIDRSFLLVPGIEYHFAYSNLFDVYTGGDLIMGRGVSVTRDDEDYTGDAYNRMQAKTPYTALGLNPFIGVNMFVANLPLSIGLEYGITAAWKFGGKTKVTNESKTAGGTVTSREFFTQENDPFDDPDANEYSKLTKRIGTISTMNNFRITLNLYFD